MGYRWVIGVVGCVVFPLCEVRAQTAELRRFQPSAGSGFFGVSVSLSGERALVGASKQDDAGTDSGAAYVFERSPSGAWTMASFLLPDDGQAFDEFGTAVALSGERALVGAPRADAAGSAAGAVYVFERQPDSTWVQTAKLLGSDTVAGDNFGFHVSLQGQRALIGAQGDDPLGSNSGSVYVLEWEGGAWVERAKLVPGDGAAGDIFGTRVSLAGERALVGAPGDDYSGLFGAGSAYLFELQPGGAWIQRAKLLPGTPGNSDGFGAALSLSGERALIGALGDDDQGVDSGAAYVFERQPGGAWSRVAKLLGAGAVSGDRFGYSVSLEGERAAVGALYQDGLAVSSGVVHWFERSASGAWTSPGRIHSSSGQTTESFGVSVSLQGDRVLVGASHNQAAGHNAGTTYAFDLLPLSSAVTEVSVSAGGTQPLELDAGHAHAGKPFVLLGSLGGTSPGLPLPSGLRLPLNPDAYLRATLKSSAHTLVGTPGLLNAFGHAEAAFAVTRTDVALVGLTFHHAFVVLGNDPVPTHPSARRRLLPGATFASNALAVQTVP